jgi:hypothetical protein
MRRDPIPPALVVAALPRGGAVRASHGVAVVRLERVLRGRAPMAAAPRGTARVSPLWRPAAAGADAPVAPRTADRVELAGRAGAAPVDRARPARGAAGGRRLDAAGGAPRRGGEPRVARPPGGASARGPMAAGRRAAADAAGWEARAR